MSSERLKKAGELFHAALEQRPEQRAIFLEQTCSGDQLLREEVESLLAAHQKAESFMKLPAVSVVAVELLDQEEQLVEGQQIGSYKIIREIGRGGMGAVYLAERADQQYKKHVAIKLIKRGMDTDYVLQHFRNERQILANFDHPNIARLLDGGSTETGLPFFVMEYVEGKAIDDYCDEQGLNITQRLELFQQVCAAVTYAHRHLVIHRDIKPSNIVVTAEGIPKLLDFGIAKILQSETSGEAGVTLTDMRVMTPEFASPEQVQGVPVTTATDVYSLGVVLYELLTGCSPYRFTSRAPLEIARIITASQPQLPSAMIDTAEAKAESAESFSKLREGSLDRLRRRLQGDLDNIVLMALRKEPERRYQSVEQFSEDIRRHLEGLPVIARKDTFSYRASKFAQRNKVAVAAAVFAILAIVVSATVAGIIQWRANQQAKFLQEFGQEAARIEGIMRFAYLLPLHDTSAEREIVMKRIRAINARMAEFGSNAQGPGHYAIGKAWMALQQYGEARKSLELAIRQYDYKTSEVAYAYGLTLAMMYQAELDFAARIATKEQLEIRMNEIKKEFKDPALSYIQEGGQSADYSEYARAMVEFLDEHYEKAIEKSQQAIQQTPWMYESLRLEGESYRHIGKELFDTGNHSQALESFRKAEEAFKSSIQQGTSDPLGYVGLCTVQSDILILQFQTGGQAEATYLIGKEACLKASRAAPKNAEVYLALASLHNRWAKHLTPHKNTLPILEEAVRVAQQAKTLQPQDPKTHKTLGEIYQRFADYYYFVRIDPSKEVALGDQSLQRAIEMNPNDADAYFRRGQIFQTLAQYLNDTGADPQAVLNKSLDVIQKAIALNPKSFTFHLAIGDILSTKAEYEAEVGLDSSDSVDSAIRALRRALEINPRHQHAYMSLGWASLVKAEYLAMVGENPMAALDQADVAYREALRIRPDYVWAHRGVAQALWRKAEFSVDSQKDPTSFVKEAKFALVHGVGNDPSDWVAYAIDGELELVLGRWKMLQQKSPESEFRRSQDLFNQAIEAGPDPAYFEVWYSKARLLRWWGEWKVKLNQSGENEIRRGLDMVSKALELNPRSAEMIGTRGIFWLILARSSSVDSQRKELLEKASGSFEEAINLNSNVSHMFTPLLKEADSLGKSN